MIMASDRQVLIHQLTCIASIIKQLNSIDGMWVMITFSLLHAIPQATTEPPKSIGLQYEQTAFDFLTTLGKPNIEFYASCINPNKAYVKQKYQFNETTTVSRVDIPVCAETGIEVEKLDDLPYYGSIVNIYTTLYSQDIKVAECVLIDDFSNTLTIQDCKGKNDMAVNTLKYSFGPEAQTALASFAFTDLQISVDCLKGVKQHYITEFDFTKEMELTDVCSDMGGLFPAYLDDSIGNLNVDYTSSDFLCYYCVNGK